jgi:hypothetical protein
MGLILVPHVVLLFLIAGENADFADIRPEEALENGIAEGAGASGDHECLIFENAHIAIFETHYGLSKSAKIIIFPMESACYPTDNDMKSHIGIFIAKKD